MIAARCVACHAVLTTPTRGPVCQVCWDAVPWYSGLLCPICGAPCPHGTTCRCDDRPPHIAAIASAARYDGPMRAIVHAFKYAGHQSLGASLAARLSEHPHLRLRDIDVIVPVPLHPWRRFHRGFNQAERLARHLRSCEQGGPPVLHALVRLRWRSAQAGLSAEQRRRNLRGAVTLRPALTRQSDHVLRTRLAGARVLLVDDVVTTGGTLSACADVLRAAGAREVRAATAARTARAG